jgi:molecular chaperone DnaK (HSP70)
MKNELLLLAEEAKKKLTTRSNHKSCVIYGTDSHTVDLTREKFDELTVELLDLTISLTRDMLKVAKDKGYTKFDQVLLVGGSSKMPQVKQRVDAELNCDAKLSDPNESVAKGAAMYALEIKAWQEAEKVEKIVDPDPPVDPEKGGEHRQQIEGPKITNVLSKTYGMGIINEKIQNIVFTQSDLPCKVSASFETAGDTTGVYLEVFESNFSAEKNSDGKYKYQTVDRRDGRPATEKQFFEFPRPLPKATPFDVQFSFNEEGLLTVYAYEPQTKSSTQFEIKITGLLSKEELEKAAKEIAITPTE